MRSEVKYLSPAEVVRTAGVGLRALKLYESRGLLKPIKTARGWRAYGPAEIARLHEILALKTLGLSLSRIAELMAGRDVDLAKTLEMQATALRAQAARIETALQLIRAASRKLAGGEALPVLDLIELIKETTMNGKPAYVGAYASRLESLMSAQELERLMHGMDISRSELIEELKALTARSEDPRSPTSFDFARRWSHLHQLAIGRDADLGSKAKAAWQDVMADPEMAKDAPYGEQEMQYMRAVGEALRDEWKRLFARLEDLASAEADPGSREAVMLVMRMRTLATVTNGHRSTAEMEAKRAQWMLARSPTPGVVVSETGLAFLKAAREQAASILDAA